MSDTPSRGVASLMAFATAGSTLGSLADGATLFTTANKALLVEFVSESVGLNQQMIDASGIRGSMRHKDTRTRFGVRSVGGQIVLQPSAIDLVNLAPILIGGTAGAHALSENGPTAFDLCIAREAKDFYYNTGKVTSVTFSSSVGGILTVSAGCVFTDEAVNAAATLSGRALTASTSQSPLMHFDTAGAVLMDSSGTPLAVTPEAISFSIDHGVMTDRFRNSNLITASPAMDRVVSLTLSLPYNAEVAAATTLYPIPYAGYGAGRISITYTNGDQTSPSALSAAFVFRVVKFTRQTPVVNGRGEVMIPFVGRAFTDGTAGATGAELVATLDGTL